LQVYVCLSAPAGRLLWFWIISLGIIPQFSTQPKRHQTLRPFGPLFPYIFDRPLISVHRPINPIEEDK